MTYDNENDSWEDEGWGTMQIDEEENKYEKNVVKYICLKNHEILKQEQQKVERLVNKLYITPSLANALLTCYHWDENKAFNEFIDKGGQQGIFNFDPDRIDYVPQGCDICYEEYSSDEFIAIGDCKHYICRDCFTDYLKTEI